MLLSLKPGVQVQGLRPEILLAILITTAIYADAGYTATITSIIDGVHKAGSRHYWGGAVDFRTRHIPADERDPLVRRIRDALGQDYFVLLEPDHLHIGFRP